MSANNMFYKEFSDELNSSFFISSSEDYEHDFEQNEFFGRFQNNYPISGVKANEEIPFELYSGFNNFNVKNQMNNYNNMQNCYENFKDEEHQEISSVDGEKEYQPKISQRKTSNDTNSTVEQESSKAHKDSINYENLFKLIEDKNMYEIGS